MQYSILSIVHVQYDIVVECLRYDILYDLCKSNQFGMFVSAGLEHVSYSMIQNRISIPKSVLLTWYHGMIQYTLNDS